MPAGLLVLGEVGERRGEAVSSAGEVRGGSRRAEEDGDVVEEPGPRFGRGERDLPGIVPEVLGECAGLPNVAAILQLFLLAEPLPVSGGRRGAEGFAKMPEQSLAIFFQNVLES